MKVLLKNINVNGTFNILVLSYEWWVNEHYASKKDGYVTACQEETLQQ